MKPLLAVLNGEMPSRRPIWFMRQAGRYLPEYKVVRDRKGGFLDLCYDPLAACEVTLQPLKRFDLDAAIVFADILVIVDAMGVKVDFAVGEGPIVEKVMEEKRVRALKEVRGVRQVEAVCETLSRVKRELGKSVTLIGFCGAPWTVASYMVEGGSSEERLLARRAAADDLPWFCDLVERLVQESIIYLEMQVRAGAEVVQIFDSWAGDLPWDLQEKWVHEPLRMLIDGFRKVCPDIPVIVFARGAGAGHERIVDYVRPQCVSLEPGVPAGWARSVLSDRAAVQGNLDPVLLSMGGLALERSVSRLLKEMPKVRHVFNLGHGIRQETDPAHVERVIEMVRQFDG